MAHLNSHVSLIVHDSSTEDEPIRATLDESGRRNALQIGIKSLPLAGRPNLQALHAIDGRNEERGPILFQLDHADTGKASNHVAALQLARAEEGRADALKFIGQVEDRVVNCNAEVESVGPWLKLTTL